jgi:Lsr2
MSHMAKTVIVKLTDDIDGGDANETVRFSLDGRSYEIDVSETNAAKLRTALQPFIENGRITGGGSRSRRPPLSDGGERTMYSDLPAEDKARFRAWAKMPTARRISDARVKSWIAAGKP